MKNENSRLKNHLTDVATMTHVAVDETLDDREAVQLEEFPPPSKRDVDVKEGYLRSL